ncbi:hypothetical protein GCM10007242_18380 [Pigmentiphaga litoralis]|jgi:hypothetical protein|uniref:hypothetical protein n=1 Tax=Pigmentiphaga litoralis TaxID=516702 RepID=UPI001672C045|nr:hypothetical protein [Pigmentiphaga litoralis]GGX12427.1 hypothetical protein GCM10007242_18380 [Pigmentiphaga litoralis]
MNMLVDELAALSSGQRPSEFPLWHRSRYAGLERIRGCLRTLAMGGHHDALLGFVAGADQAEYAAQLLSAEGLAFTLMPNGPTGLLHVRWSEPPTRNRMAVTPTSLLQRQPDVMVDVFWNLKTSRAASGG